MKKKLYNRPVCVVLSEDMHQRISEVTEKEEISISEYIRRAVENFIRQNEFQKGDI